ncbi:hypothetical protein VPNG_02134 [Cytospora leucostoma]|uniref:Uncharacterized protein n=1 Tax=Cytospora leucostoma TaxID=1230097 RepID=A0A423XHF3_9PEZI|nr:hypothetical protein VPNG_02134 [Cytospora leucostoma]
MTSSTTPDADLLMMVEAENPREHSQPAEGSHADPPPSYEDVVDDGQSRDIMNQQRIRTEASLEFSLQRSQEQLERVQAALEAAQKDLQQSDAKVKTVTRQWKKAATELDTLRSQRQGFYQVTDDCLTTLIRQLRYSILSFSIQYFGGEPQTPAGAEVGSSWGKKIMEDTTPGSRAFNDYLDSRKHCPSIIQAFIWRVLSHVVFDRVHWVGDRDLRWKVLELYNQLEPKDSNLSLPTRYEQFRKFQVWRASTTGLVLDLLATRSPSGMDNETSTLRSLYAERISKSVAPFFRSKPDGHLDLLCQIIQEAVDLDQEISRQVARVQWVFEPTSTDHPFSFSNQAGAMELEKDEINPPDEDPMVHLVIAPGVKKRGRSTGECFDEEVWLVPMEVTCSKSTRMEVTYSQPTRRSRRFER